MNLKETYSSCVQTCARLDVIEDKIRECIGQGDDVVK
jgi:hypothetical protein